MRQASGQSIGLVFIAILIIAVALAYFLLGPGSDDKREAQALSEEIFNFDLIDSPLQQIKVPDIDINIPLNFGNFSPNILDLSVNSLISIKAPDIKF